MIPDPWFLILDSLSYTPDPRSLIPDPWSYIIDPRCGIAWRIDSICIAIMAILRKVQVSKYMSFQQALKYTIHQKKFEIRKKLPLTAAEAQSSGNNEACVGNVSISDNKKMNFSKICFWDRKWPAVSVC